MQTYTAVNFRRGRGGRHANENLPIIQVEIPTNIIEEARNNLGLGSAKINKHGALDVIRQNHGETTTFTFLFATEEAASTYEREFKSMSEDPESGLSLSI